MQDTSRSMTQRCTNTGDECARTHKTLKKHSLSHTIFSSTQRQAEGLEMRLSSFDIHDFSDNKKKG